MIQLFNSLTNKLETLSKKSGDYIKVYICGPTVYNYMHIGNARPVVCFDVLNRLLNYEGYKVKYVSNFTDVDDKIIDIAEKLNVNEKELARKYIEACEADFENLNVLKPFARPKVTEHMSNIIVFIEKLIKEEYAYVVNGNVYFRVRKINEYGKLSNRTFEMMQSGARVDINVEKEYPYDFTLWKATQRGISWDSPWSKGRPGWHTECVVLINDILGEDEIDIHAGGMDLKFPHHENEIAQSIAIRKHKLAKIWLHNGFLNIDNQKMSKSDNNGILLKDLLQKYNGDVIRLALLSSSYRAPLNFSEELLLSQQTLLKKINSTVRTAQIRLNLNKFDFHFELNRCNSSELSEFIDCLNNDLSTSSAITSLLNIIKSLNNILRAKKNDNEDVYAKLSVLYDMYYILGLDWETVRLSISDIELYRKWENYKISNDYEKADEIREILVKKEIL